MKKILTGLLVLTTSNVFSQVEISKDVMDVMKMLSVSQGDVKGLEEIKSSTESKDKGCPPEMKNEIKPPPPLVIAENKKNKWEFSVRTTMTGPKGKLEKTFVTPDKSRELRTKLNGIIHGEYSSYDERMKAVSRECSGLSEFQKISMSSMLADRLSQIYDYSRANGGSDAVVKPEQQWEALRSGQAVGVCRDASITVSQFLIACGFSKDQIAIKSYRTEDSGHQITSIRTKDGEFTINWDELYQTGGNDFKSPEPNIPNTGLFYTLYDPQTGKIIEQRRTELADALKILSGGKTKDPYYTPEMIVAEAAYGGFAGKVFQTVDEMGNDAKGAAFSYNSFKGNERSFSYISIGGAYAMNERSIPISSANTRTLNQDIFYFQTEAKIQKEYPLFSSKTGKLSIAPKAGISSDYSLSRNQFNKNTTNTFGSYSEFSGGMTVFYDTDPVKLHVGSEVVGGFTTKLHNSENENGNVGAYVTRYVVNGGASWENEKYVASANSNIVIAQTEKQMTLGAALKHKKAETSCEAYYSVYDRTYGTREDYIVTKCQKDFGIKRVGKASVDTHARIPLNHDYKDTMIGIGATLKFK